ncbi:MAG: PVC-type heme-binding CxxCH protein [Planctomycetota bacterium]|jgi:putative membrane-bound dehydrogenase-like protein
MRAFALSVLFVLSVVSTASAQRLKIPRRHDKPPGPPISAQEAVKKMTVPEGFSVEIVAAEPDVVNPVGMAIDERGRFWVTESFEYPRRSPGPGRDRVKVLEDTDADGKVDTVSVFLGGLNIPSGIAVGHGGVWVANSPDILFVPDADRDGVADGKPQVVVTGFGRTDTHELPNSLTWGPDGWLYGLNGVFNHSHVRYPENNPNFDKDHPGWKFTCALFRINPRTREFQIFAEGTSNPWGVAFNDDGEAFLSACVIDHLWHITETGYYHRQGGPYPPFTWKIESIVDHKHQKAAYCGIHWFDSDAYPEKYRRKLYMGNIHGGCINSDRLEKNGSTYKGLPEPDFLTANDAWFMPVVQKTGSDGCLYILDWYDRYHCYQDANADPEGIERAKGRLYRVRYKQSPRVEKGFDLAKKADDELIDLLGVPNDYVRWTATRLLQERGSTQIVDGLVTLLADDAVPQIQRRHAMFALVGISVLHPQHEQQVTGPIARLYLNDNDAVIRARAGHTLLRLPKLQQNLFANVDKADWSQLKFEDRPAEMNLATAINLSTVPDSRTTLEGFLLLLAAESDDPLIPRIIWQNLHPRLETMASEFVAMLSQERFLKAVNATQMMPRIVERILGRKSQDLTPVAALFELLTDDETGSSDLAAQTLDVLAQRVQTRQIKGEQLDQLASLMREPVADILDRENESRLRRSALLLAASWKDETGLTAARVVLANARSDDYRLAALRVLVSVRDEEALGLVEKILLSDETSAKLRAGVIASLGDHTHERVASVVLAGYQKLNEEYIRPKAIELLTQRSSWAKELLKAIGKKQVPVNSLNQNQVRRLLEGGDEELKQLVEKHWGTIRTTRDPKRVELIAEMKKFIRANPGDAGKGAAVFKKVCGQCHKIYGEGAEVGPDITANGRGNFDQLLSNVFDPSLVIGASYQARTVITSEGRVLTGLPVEENDQRIVLKVQGGKLETIPRGEIDVVKVSELSMMPEQLEKQLKPEELADLFAFLILDKPPSDPTAKVISGVKGGR